MERLFDAEKKDKRGHLNAAFAYTLIHDLLEKYAPQTAAACKVVIREQKDEYKVTITTFHTMTAVVLRTRVSEFESELTQVLKGRHLITDSTEIVVIIRQ